MASDGGRPANTKSQPRRRNAGYQVLSPPASRGRRASQSSALAQRPPWTDLPGDVAGGGPGHVHLGSTQMGRHDLGARFDVTAVEQGVAEGLGWGSAKAGVFLWELTRCTRVKCLVRALRVCLRHVGLRGSPED